MNLKRSFALIPLLSLSLLAEGPKFAFEGQVSVVGAHGDMKKMVKSSALDGYNAGLAFRTATKGGIDVRLYANLMSLKGIEDSGLEKTSPSHLNVGVDFIRGFGKLSVFGGFGMMKWKQEDSPTTLPNFTDNNNKNNQGKGTKLAGRVGIEYAITDKLHGVFSFTQAEFNKVYQPSWLSLGVSYRFMAF